MRETVRAAVFFLNTPFVTPRISSLSATLNAVVASSLLPAATAVSTHSAMNYACRCASACDWQHNTPLVRSVRANQMSSTRAAADAYPKAPGVAPITRLPLHCLHAYTPQLVFARTNTCAHICAREASQPRGARNGWPRDTPAPVAHQIASTHASSRGAIAATVFLAHSPRGLGAAKRVGGQD